LQSNYRNAQQEIIFHHPATGASKKVERSRHS